MPLSIDVRKGDRHKPRAGDRHKNRPHGHKARTLAYSADRFVAVDGEGIQHGAGKDEYQTYSYLADSTGREIWDPDGLSTRRCLDFLCGLGDSVVVVGFGIGYDVEKWLGDLDESARTRLDKSSYTVWNEFRIKYWSGMKFEVWRYNGKERTGYCRVDDIKSNVEGSWEKVVGDRLKVLEGDKRLLAEGKEKRGRFTEDDLVFIRKYTGLELKQIVQVTAQLVAARKAAGFVTCDLYSGANTTTESFKKNGIAKVAHESWTNVPEEMVGPAYRAMFGGRVEALAYGTYNGKVWEYDITSAYPSILSRIPHLGKGAWVRTGAGYFHALPSDPAPPAVYLVRWRYPPNRNAYPFLFRSSEGLRMPSAGMGWVWSPELLVPLVYDGDYIEILEGWVWAADPLFVERPFAFMKEDFKTRTELKNAHNPAEYAIKKSLNSAYGKTAQKKSALVFDKAHRTWRHQKPTFHNILYAGLTTSWVRALLYAASYLDGGCLTFMTDAYLTTSAEPPKISLGGDLGQWKREEYDGAQILQSGVYRLKIGDKWAKEKGRGWGEGVPWDDIENGWNDGKDTITVKKKDRFWSHRFAAQRDRLEMVGRWEKNVKQEVCLRAVGKRSDLPNRRSRNPARELVWTEAKEDRITEFDMSAPNLPPWEIEKLRNRETPVWAPPKSRVRPAVVEASPRGGGVAGPLHTDRIRLDDRIAPIRPLALPSLGTAP